MQDEFSKSLSYALSALGVPSLSPKEEQKLVIRAAYDGKDVFVWLPTGFGKSLCFQALPFVFDCKRSLVSADVESRSAVIVVAPLVALMVEQVQRLREEGINAVIISSGGREGRVPGDLQATESTFASASFIFSSPEAAAQNKTECVKSGVCCSRGRSALHFQMVCN